MTQNSAASTPSLPPRGGTGASPVLPSRGGGGTKKGLLAGGLALVLLAGAGTAYALTRGEDPKQVSIGTTEASEPYWGAFKDVAKKRGIDVRLVNFSDYTQANPALSQGQLDTNSFQHLLFLANWNVKNHGDLRPVGSTYIVPLSLYSKKHRSLAQLPPNAQVAIPNDPTNQARALLVLQQAGLLTLKSGAGALSTPTDIASSKIKVEPVDPAQTVTSLPSVDAAIVNNNFALDAKLDPNSALYKDDPSKPIAKPYTNVFAVRAKDVDDDTYKKLVEIYHDPAVVKALKDQTKGTAVVVDRPQAELQQQLDDLENTVKAAR